MSRYSLWFSVVIPARNASHTLHDCLNSLHSQTLTKDKYEIIVVDNESIDTTREIVLSHGVGYIYSDNDCVAGVRNCGALHTQGKVIAFLDADMITDPLWLTTAYTYYFENEYTGILGFADYAPAQSHYIAKVWYNPHRRNYSNKRRVDCFPTRNLCINRDLFFKAGKFDQALFKGGKTGEDKEFTYRVYAMGYPVTVDSSLHMIHTGTEKNVLHFFKKEWWHQGMMLCIAKKHGYPFRLLQSPIMSFLHGLSLFVFLCMAKTRHFRVSRAAFFFWTFPSLVLTLKKARILKMKHHIVSVWFLNVIRYTIAAAALLPQIWRILRNTHDASSFKNSGSGLS